MGLEEILRDRLGNVLDALTAEGRLTADALRSSRFSVEPPRRGGTGDLATNAALVLARATGQSPRELATSIARCLAEDPWVQSAEVAGPGFVNVALDRAAFFHVLSEILAAGRGYGRAPAATKSRINVEFVSANPTGPLLVSHGRGAILGDVVARLLEATGHRVTREYYINDFGNQVRLLADSVLAIAAGREPPEGGYGGGYVEELGAWFRAHRPDLLEPNRDEERRRQCVLLMLEGIDGSDLLGIRPMLRAVGIEFDVWSSEEALHRWGRVDRALRDLAARDRLRTAEDGAVYFVTGDEDDKDRVVKKSNGDYTYFASDIAYHEDKLGRGFERLLNLWGADHHGYVARLRSAIESFGGDANAFEVVLFQLVKLVRDGREVRMGKRLGNLITLQEVVEEIDEAVGNPHAGRDALRVFYLSRRADTSIVLDLDLAKRQEAENPVFYIQYGHARLASIQRRAAERFGIQTPRYTDALARYVTHPLELSIIADLGRYPAVLEDAAVGRDPHKLVFYLNGLAQSFQSYYSQTKKDRDTILPGDSDLVAGKAEQWNWDRTRGRLLWVDAIRTVYSSGLAILGLDAPERMVRPTAEDDGELGDADG
ncbi:MAG: arginine--tRNA ligase [Polyangiaceae bacterium]|nr:arginine--tRNA ligase [Polyangiaceae bacterium]